MGVSDSGDPEGPKGSGGEFKIDNSGSPTEPFLPGVLESEKVRKGIFAFLLDQCRFSRQKRNPQVTF